MNRYRPKDPEKAKAEFLRKLEGKRKPKRGTRKTPAPMVKFERVQWSNGLFIRMPVHIVSESNRHEHWTKKDERRADQAEAVTRALPQFKQAARCFRVLLSHLGPKEIDAHDNLHRAFKSVADAVAHWIGWDDADPRIAWSYDQRVQKQNGIEIRIEWD